MNDKQRGKLIGVGVGPGDPQLITMKGWKAIQSADVICYIASEQGTSQAKHIAREALATLRADVPELSIKVPMSNDRRRVNQIYDEAMHAIEQYLADGKQVVFLCEGDPLFFGSFAYLLERVPAEYSSEVIPGISSVHAAAASLHRPLTMLKESLAVVSGRHDEQKLLATLAAHDSVVIMKAGRSRAKILSVLNQSGRIHEAVYLEYISREQQTIVKDVASLDGEAGPYFSLFVVTRTQRDQT